MGTCETRLIPRLGTGLGMRPAKIASQELRMKPPFSLKDVTITIGGVEHRGTYYVSNSIVYVRSEKGTKATQIAGSAPEVLARMLLSELVRS